MANLLYYSLDVFSVIEFNWITYVYKCILVIA